MLEGINIVAVVGTSLFMMASATVWFSPLMFGRAWLRELKVTEAEIEESRKNMYLHLSLTAFLYVIALSVIAQIVVRVNYLDATLMQAGVAITCLVTAVLANTALWENRTLTYFLINAGFYAYVVLVSLFMISYWPW